MSVTIRFLLLLLLVGFMPQWAAGQLVTTWINGGGAGTGNWNIPGNWSGGSVPDINVEDLAVINGGGTAQVSSLVASQAGGLVLGQAAGNSGTLEIQNNGNLTLVNGGPSLPQAPGTVVVGQAGAGTLRVLPGGTLTSAGISVGAGSSMTLGATTPATATNVTTGAVTLSGTTRVVGPNVNFNSNQTGAGITFQGSSVLIPQVTGATHSPLKTTGVATLDGTVQVQFTGFTPTAASTWNLVDANAIAGSFAQVVTPAGYLGLGQVLAVRNVNGGTNGRVAQMYVNQLPVLNVNRTTGAVSLSNPGTSGIELDGYGILSQAGALNMANWVSLASSGVAGPGWSEANPSPNHLAEVRAGGSTTLGAGISWPLGATGVFQKPAFTQFGENFEDLVLQYTNVDGTIANGVVNYTGGTNINNLTLFVNPSTGNVSIRNTSPFSVQIDGYTISSAAGSLNSNPALWTSLQDQPGAAGTGWFESNLSDNRVSELKSGGATTLNPNGATTFNLGGLFKTTSPKDLIFEFLMSGPGQPQSIPFTGVVVYEPAPAVVSVLGDYNGNNVVDAADYVLWRNGGPLLNDPTPGVQPADYQFWRSRFGATSGSGSGGGMFVSNLAVPEPSTWMLVFAGSVVLSMSRLAAAPMRGGSAVLIP